MKRAAVIGVVYAIGLLLAAPASADARRTEFTGRELVGGGAGPTIIPIGGGQFHVLSTQSAVEEATDARVSGNATIVLRAIWQQPPALLGPMWGSYRLVNEGGEWNGFWHGSRTMVGADLVTAIVLTAVGSGGYEGLSARWTLHGVNPGPQNPYLYYEGFIVEASPRQTTLPITWHASRVESLNTITGDFRIEREVAEGTHLGRSTNAGFGFGLPMGETMALTGTGCVTAANGDLLYWVLTGSLNATDGMVSVQVHFAGGTGRFEAAVGEMTGTVAPPLGPPDENGIQWAEYSFMTSGTIGY